MNINESDSEDQKDGCHHTRQEIFDPGFECFWCFLVGTQDIGADPCDLKKDINIEDITAEYQSDARSQYHIDQDKKFVLILIGVCFSQSHIIEGE